MSERAMKTKKVVKQPVPLPKLLRKAQDVFNRWVRVYLK